MSRTPRSPVFIVSLDFELYWGVRDHVSLDAYRANLLGVRQAVPAMLKLFSEYAVHATWATVGFLFCSGREELLANLPEPQPRYVAPDLSPYKNLERLGRSEEEDPYHFAPSLIRLVAATSGQEIGTHTLSHYCCLEPQQDPEAFRADLHCAQKLASGFGIHLRSLVFPRNQYDDAHLQVCRQSGLAAYRGTEDSWLYRGRSGKNESALRRAGRFLDAHMNLTGDHSFALSPDGQPVNLPSSRFLRPWSGDASLDWLRLARIRSALRHAAEKGETFHLWWHPHNFGIHLQENLDMLRAIFEEFARLRETHGMRSLNMAEAAQEIFKGSAAHA